MRVLKGLILKAVSGFYYCISDGKVYECRARGVFRSEEITPLVGDRVEFEVDENSNGCVTKIFARINEIARPPIANLDRLFIVSSIAEPSPSLLVIDKLITICEYKKISPVIVITKTDLGNASALRDIYESAGFLVVTLCNLDLQERDLTGLDMLRQYLSDGVNAMCGNTGVGKSSLLNNLFPELSLNTNSISKKLGRGRHTTRAVELYRIPKLNSYVADTPGFGSIQLSRYDVIHKEQLAGCFREFAPYLDKCRFTGCSHTVEKGCAVLEALHAGKISASRFKSYVALYNEAKQIKDWEI